MMTLHFEGWFQCRLATDPDPTDERRGVTGATFAAAGEPDLDGVIRFNNPVAARSHGPDVGVRVSKVTVDGKSQSEHPLLAAAVDLLGEPRFQERNGVIARSGDAAIDPFIIRIFGGGIRLQRQDLWDPRQPDLRAYQLSETLLKRRQPASMPGGMFEMNSPEVADATGIADFPGYFAVRRQELEADLAVADADTQRVALEKRIEALKAADWRILFRLGFRARYGFALNGRPEVLDPNGSLKGNVLTSAFWLPHWPLTFWFGGFDSDALCGYVRGTLDIPFQSAAGSTA